MLANDVGVFLQFLLLDDADDSECNGARYRIPAESIEVFHARVCEADIE